MAKKSPIHILGGGTVSHVRSHFAITAAAYGGTARALHALLAAQGIPAELHLTKMASAGQSDLETNQDISRLTDAIVADPASKVVIFNVAVTDFDAQIGTTPSGKYATRLKSRDAAQEPLTLKPADKIVPGIKARRPDIFLVAFKTTAGADDKEQYQRGLTLLKDSRADLILANDTRTRRNILIAADGKILCDTQDRAAALQAIADNISKRFPALAQKKSPARRHGPA